MQMRLASHDRVAKSLVTLPRLLFSYALLIANVAALGVPPGPTPVVPAGGGPPGAFPNTSVSAVNVVARGSTTFNGNVEITGFDGEGPIPWTVTKYNRGDIAMRLAPANPSGADANTLNRGFIDFTSATDASLAECRSWRPHPALGVAIPTARQNGPIDWGDGEGPLYPTVAISASSSGAGYDMVDGTFGTGQLDINLGRAGTHASSPEANFGFSVAWFPYDAGWIAGNMGNPADVTTGAPQWNGAGQHAAGLTPGLMTWSIPPSPPGDGVSFGGLGLLRLPGVNAETNGMLFTTSSHGNSDVNIVGVAPTNDLASGASGWIVTIREDAALTGDEVATAGQFQFEFVYVPYNAQNLIGGHINGSTGGSLQSAGAFTLTRTGTGTYELSISGKAGTNGTLLLQVADYEPGTTLPMASRAFLSYQYNPGNGRFVIQCRKATSDTVSDLTDANFYFAWVDFQNPLSPPEGPRLRNRDAVAVSDPLVINAKEGNIAVNTDEPEVLVTTIDQNNSGSYTDPTTTNVAVQSLVGYFYDPRTLTRKRGPFFIMGNGSLNGAGQITRHDVKYNPVSHQYDVVGCARQYTADAQDVLMIARVNPDSVAGANDPLVNVFIYDGLTNGTSYDDVSLAVSTPNGNFIVVAEHKVPGQSGEGAYGALFSSNGTVLTPTPTRLDLLQPTGDVDDPDVVYLPKKDVFLFISNTDLSGGLANRIVGSVVQTAAPGGNLQVSGPEQLLAMNSGSAQGHAAAIENPFNGEILTAYDNGNDTSTGQLTYYTVGAGPSYTFTQARPQAPYLAGPTAGNPFRHQHPQLAADPSSGVLVIGYQSRNSTVGLPNAYVFSVLDTNGAVMPSQLGAPYFLADSVAGLIDTGANYHNIKYDPSSDSFVAAFTAGSSGSRVVYLASVTVTSAHLPLGPVTIERSGNNVTIRWPAGTTLQEATSITGTFTDVPGPPTSPLTIPATGTKFYRWRL
jgi:hypothetical protein